MENFIFVVCTELYMVLWGVCAGALINILNRKENLGILIFCILFGLFWPVVFPALLMYYILRRNSE